MTIRCAAGHDKARERTDNGIFNMWNSQEEWTAESSEGTADKQTSERSDGHSKRPGGKNYNNDIGERSKL